MKIDLQEMKIKILFSLLLFSIIFFLLYGANRAGMKTVSSSSNQGGRKPNRAETDLITYQFAELWQALAFFEGQ